MKKIYFSLVLGCLVANASDVVTTILPTKYFVDKITNGEISVDAMVGGSSNPHTYEPKPKQMKDLEEAKIYFGVGIEFDNKWGKKFTKQYPNLLFVDTSANIEKIAMQAHSHGDEEEHGHHDHAHHDHDHHEHSHHDHDHHEHGHHAHDHHEHGHSIDPHVWLDPVLAKAQSKNILDALCKVYDDKCDKFSENFAKFSKELDDMDAYAKDKFKDIKNNKFVIYHPALGYFAKRYGLEQLSVEINGKEPKPAQLAKLTETIKNENIKVVFVAKNFPVKSAEVLAKSTGANIVMVNFLDENWQKQMQKIIDEIAKSL